MSANDNKTRENAMLILLATIKQMSAASQDPTKEAFDEEKVADSMHTARLCSIEQARETVKVGFSELSKRHTEITGADRVGMTFKAISGRAGADSARMLREYAIKGEQLDDSVIETIAALQVAPAAVVDDVEDDVTTPFNASLVDHSIAQNLNALITRSTQGQVKGAKDLFQRLERAEVHLFESRSARLAHKAAVESGAVQPGQDLPMWTSERKKLGDILEKSEIGGTSVNVAKLLAHEVKVWSCNVRTGTVPRIDPHYIFDGAALAKALYAIDAGENLTFVGPPGCGKTTITKQLAARLGRPFYRIPIDGEMRRTEIIGGFKQVADANGSRTQWFDGLLTKGITEPSIIDLDEIDRGDPDLLYAAHAVLEREGISILEDAGRYVPMHPDCSILATANTKGRADVNGLYASVNEMSVATHDRIPFWHDCDYQSQEDEASMLERKVPGLLADDAKKIAKIAAGLRVVFKEGRMRTSFSARQTIAAGRYAVFLTNSGITRNALKDAITAVFETRAVDEADGALIREAIGMAGI